MLSYSWVACDLKTGVVLDDLPLLDGSQPGSNVQLLQSLGRYETTNVSLPLVNAPTNWQRDTLPGATTMVCLQQSYDTAGNMLGSPVPVWGAGVTSANLDQSDAVQLTLTTIEGYMDRRYTGDQTFTATGQNDIVNALVTNMASGPNGGIPITVQYVTAGSGTPRDRTYADQDDKTVYSALTDLMGVQGGPEWWVGWTHLTAPERYVPVLYVGDRIGQPATAGLAANASFDMPGPVQSFQLIRDYSDGKGANAVMAYSSGQGTTRPQSPVQTFTDPVRPTYEYRWTPSTSIIDTTTLTGWATSALTQMQAGSTALAMSAIASDKGCPQLGVDWNIGDDIGFSIGGLDQNGRDTVPAFPGGVSGTARCIGWQLELSNTPIITPVLAGPQIS